MNLFGIIEFGSYFGTELRVVDGEECLQIPLRFNPSIRVMNGRAVAMFKIKQRSEPDEFGFSHLIVPHIPQSVAMSLPEADYRKMSNPIGKLKVLEAPIPRAPKDQPRGLDHTALATNPVQPDDIPL